MKATTVQRHQNTRTGMGSDIISHRIYWLPTFKKNVPYLGSIHMCIHVHIYTNNVNSTCTIFRIYTHAHVHIYIYTCGLYILKTRHLFIVSKLTI